MSLSRTQSPADVQKEREASKLRLLDVWSSLAERYSRRLDEDDIVDIRTGEIMIDRGFIRKSRKVDFGAIAAPAAEDAIFDEGTDEEEEDDDLDELDAFADTTSEVDITGQIEMGLRAKPVPPVSVSDLADAEDLREFLEAERRRKDLCGSDVEDEDDDSPSDQNQEPEVVEHEVVDLVSEDELDNWDVDESSIVYPVLKQEEESDIEFVEGPSSTNNVRVRSPSIVLLTPPKKSTSPQAETKTEVQHETLGESSRKRKRVSSDFESVSSDPESVFSDSESVPDLPFFKDQSPTPNRKPSRLHCNNFQSPYHYPYPPPPPHHQQQQHHPLPPEMFMPDPRAQFIIAQAMHQLSSLVGTPWTPPHTPSRRHQSRQANSIFNTPYHSHPYPYSYDPNLSLATLPPESPESNSSPEKLSHEPRKSSMARSSRSRSRGRRVSFQIDRGRSDDRVDVYSSPSRPRSRREERKSTTTATRPSEGKGKARAETPDSSPSKHRSRCEVVREHKPTTSTRPSEGKGKGLVSRK
jgi:hypothetical protein